MPTQTHDKFGLLDDLTEPQIEAVTHVDGPLLVLAGPGSGKTRVITRRVAHLIHAVGIAPWNVLAITFTNKAAGEMQDRISQLVTERQARAVTVRTFHSFCALLLRRHAEHLGLPPGYSIYDTADQQRAVKRVLEDLEINSKNFPPSGLLAAISNAKNELMDADAFARTAGDFYARTVARVYTKYDEILRRNHALDFDDLLLRTVDLLRGHRGVLAELQQRYQYILIDEYQDTNHAQFMIASALASTHKNLCATGDPDQSIYAWRGADIRNILDFENHYPEARVVRLEQNYRSTKYILAAADGLIRNNSRRKHKKLWTHNPEGEPVTVVSCYDERHEAQWLAEQLQRMHDEQKLAWSGMAIFYRINSLSRVVEDALRSAAIPYQIARGTAFYDRAEIKNITAYLRTIVNPADEVSLLRVINTPPRGIGDRSVKALKASALTTGRPMDQMIADPGTVANLGSRAQSGVAKFSRMLNGWRQTAGLERTGAQAQTAEPSLHALVERIIRESGLHAQYQNDASDPDAERLANLGEFITFAQQFEAEHALESRLDGLESEPSLGDKLLGFLERISLVSDVDSVAPEQGAVTLMTLHSAKGLEYELVAVIGVEEGLLPHERARSDEAEMEEERRLCFVGLTRAMRKLLLTRAQYRTVFGQSQTTIASRFLGEMPSGAMQIEDRSADYEPPADLIAKSARIEAMQFPPGTQVRHPRFGLGTVLTVGHVGASMRARINFNTAGPKTLILEYAPLERVE